MAQLVRCMSEVLVEIRRGSLTLMPWRLRPAQEKLRIGELLQGLKYRQKDPDRDTGVAQLKPAKRRPVNPRNLLQLRQRQLACFTGTPDARPQTGKCNSNGIGKEIFFLMHISIKNDYLMDIYIKIDFPHQSVFEGKAEIRARTLLVRTSH